jgi:hypothetical protein
MPEENNNYQKQSLKNDIHEYIEKRIQLITLVIAEQISLIVANSFQRLLGMLFLSGALCFLMFALAIYLGDLLDSLSAGFAIVSIPLLICGLLFFNKKSKKITEKIQAEIIGKVLENIESKKEKE